MLYRWLTYDRQDGLFKFIADLDYTETTPPRMDWDYLKDKRVWRYAPRALYQFPDGTEFPTFTTEYLAWQWYYPRAVPASKVPLQVELAKFSPSGLHHDAPAIAC